MYFFQFFPNNNMIVAKTINIKSYTKVLVNINGINIVRQTGPAVMKDEMLVRHTLN